MAVYVGSELLLVRPSYRFGWHLPGGSLRRSETPETAARRELAEEIGLSAPALRSAGSTCIVWDGRRHRVHFFELHLVELPKLQLDNREIIAARLSSPVELQRTAAAGPLLAYLTRRQLLDSDSEPTQQLRSFAVFGRSSPAIPTR